MNEFKKILKDFIDWASDCGEEMSYIFDNPDEAVERFLEERIKLEE